MGTGSAEKARHDRHLGFTVHISIWFPLKCVVVEIDPAFTSQTCNVCGWVDKASRHSQAEFTCVACGHADHADLNAARNIMAFGIGASARRGAFALATPVTREIDRKQAA